VHAHAGMRSFVCACAHTCANICILLAESNWYFCADVDQAKHCSHLVNTEVYINVVKCLKIHVSKCIHISTHIHVYICIEREREGNLYIFLCKYIYVYM